jgi:hypothetical protein
MGLEPTTAWTTTPGLPVKPPVPTRRQPHRRHNWVEPTYRAGSPDGPL